MPDDETPGGPDEREDDSTSSPPAPEPSEVSPPAEDEDLIHKVDAGLPEAGTPFLVTDDPTNA